MTRADYTALTFVVDRSGSMAPVATDMEGAIETLIADQRGLPGKLTVDYVRFDDKVEYVEHFADPAKIKIKIQPRNTTALYDAVGTTINTFGNYLAAMPEEERPGKVIFAIVSDGLENASRDFTADRVKELTERQASQYNWEFTYLGANQNAVQVAQGIGIAAQSALTYDVGDVAMASASLSNYVTRSRVAGVGNVASFTEAERAANAPSGSR